MLLRRVNIKNNYEIKIPRRNFLNIFIGGVSFSFLSTIIFPIIKYLIPPKSPEVTPSNFLAGVVGELKNSSGKIFRFGNKPGILINAPTGELKTFSAVCTHLECTVQYRDDLQHIWCACHNGHYDLNGRNISGPPPGPLEKFNLNIKNNEIFVQKEDRI
jgi:Rieske Fe-S protein